MPGGMRKIGIANVNKWLKEIYGESCGLKIISEEGAGTKIVMRIPYREYEE
jgi:sensor histidine kinase YesM